MHQFGTNSLYVKAIDIAGKEDSKMQSYAITEGVDVLKPKIDIDLSNSRDGIIKIIAEDETALSYITYRWNNEEEQRVDVENEGDTTIEETIELPRGENTLTVKAVDANNNEETKTQPFTAGKKPEITVVQYANKLTIKATDEEALDRVEFVLNEGTPNRWISKTEGRKEWEYEIEIPEGTSTIVINAWNKLGIKSNEFRGRCSYTP